jgi:rare lipoprotein A
MKSTIQLFAFSLLILTIFSCSSTKEIPKDKYGTGQFIETGIASWYGPNFNGKPTANGETYNMHKLTAAHRTLPFNSIVKVVNKMNNKSVIVRINDRGPYAKDRIIDLSKQAAEKINMIKNGTTPVDLFLLNKTKIPKNIKVPKYSVQVGSYTNRIDALKVSSQIANSRIVKVLLNENAYYRIYVGFFSNINEAKKLKNLLNKKGIMGFVKQVAD